MDLFYAAILGVIEGITEFLPISSTGHLIIVERLLGIPSTEFLKTFDIVIQLGAIMAVLVIYGKRLLTSWELIKRLALAFIPTALVGWLLYGFIKDLLGSSSVVIWALGIGGVLLIAFEWWYKEPADAHEDLAQLPYHKAFLIGIAQSLAVIPGVSRAAATILGGLSLGLSRRAIIEFSFLLALPTMAAASAFDLYKNAHSFSLNQWHLLLVGFFVAWVTAWAAIRWLLQYVRTHDFTAFGVYRIVFALACALILF